MKKCTLYGGPADGMEVGVPVKLNSRAQVTVTVDNTAAVYKWDREQRLFTYRWSHSWNPPEPVQPSPSPGVTVRGALVGLIVYAVLTALNGVLFYCR